MSDSDKAGELLGQIPAVRDGLPPVHLWNPPFCGDIDMRIDREGTWYYLGSPIGRKPMVKLFSSVLKREGDAYFLVTPVEKVGIRVDVAPFVAVALQVEGQGRAQRLHLVTNVDETLVAGAEHPLRVEEHAETGEPAPFVRVRGNLEALVHRNVFYQLVELAVPGEVDGQPWLGVWSDGVFFPIGREG